MAAGRGVVNVRIAELERLNRLDPLEVFTIFDGQIVERGDLVASIKVAPHLVEAATVDAGARLADFGSRPLVWVAPFVAGRVGVVVKESVRATARERFEASVRTKVEGLGSTMPRSSTPMTTRRGRSRRSRRFAGAPDQADLVLTAGAASTDPLDPFFVAIEALGGRVVRRGVPAHPGSMLWLARVGRDHDPRPADLRGLFQGDRGRPAAAATALGRASLRTDRRPARPRRHPDPVPAVPVPAYARELEAPDG